MVSDIKFADLDGDKTNEMIVVGEWMPISVYKWQSGKYVNQSNNWNTAESTGWWNALQVADLDNDGDLDLIAGNEGLNTRLKVSATEPLQMFAKDFDNNGAIDPIITYYNQGRSWPLPQKEAITKQMPSLKKKILYYRDYAKSTLTDLFAKKDVDASYQLNAKTFHTSWFENDGKGKLVQHILPIESQFSPIFGITVTDLNKDGYSDLILVGNKWDCEPETGQQDAGNGLVLLNNKNRTFSSVLGNKSGFYAPHNAKSILPVIIANKKFVIVGNNNGPFQSFLIN
jgi:hypothetical protein